jgi:hypothetical protein
MEGLRRRNTPPLRHLQFVEWNIGERFIVCVLVFSEQWMFEGAEMDSDGFWLACYIEHGQLVMSQIDLPVFVNEIINMLINCTLNISLEKVKM